MSSLYQLVTWDDCVCVCVCGGGARVSACVNSLLEFLLFPSWCLAAPGLFTASSLTSLMCVGMVWVDGFEHNHRYP